MGSTANPIAQASFSTTAFSYQPLLSDGDDVVSRNASMASGGGVHKRGEILKYDPATGILTVPAAAADCNCILVNDIDATSAATQATVYVSGKFKADAIVWPAALAHGPVTDALRDFSILIESVVYVDGTLVRSAPSPEQEAAARAAVAANLAAATSTTTTAAPGEAAAVSSDSLWPYLTPEQQAQQPQLATPPLPTTTAAPGGSTTTTPAPTTTATTTTPAPTTSV